MITFIAKTSYFFKILHCDLYDVISNNHVQHHLIIITVQNSDYGHFINPQYE